MFTAAFWAAAFERAVKTFAQALLATLAAGPFGVLDAPWQTAASLAGMAALLSILTSMASSSKGNPGPSLAGEQLADTSASPLR
jgi:hypothetical protein